MLKTLSIANLRGKTIELLQVSKPFVRTDVGHAVSVVPDFFDALTDEISQPKVKAALLSHSRGTVEEGLETSLFMMDPVVEFLQGLAVVDAQVPELLCHQCLVVAGEADVAQCVEQLGPRAVQKRLAVYVLKTRELARAEVSEPEIEWFVADDDWAGCGCGRAAELALQLEHTLVDVAQSFERLPANPPVAVEKVGLGNAADNLNERHDDCVAWT